MGKSHCDTCLKLDKCWFVDEKEKMPNLPQHPFCHCTKEPLPISQVLHYATAASAFSKFDVYLFNSENRYKDDKRVIFESWGYTIEDCQWLKDEIERQGLEKYQAGEYTLGDIDEYGQRVNIRIELLRKDTGEVVSFKSGWMACPNGHIQLNTPYGGK